MKRKKSLFFFFFAIIIFILIIFYFFRIFSFWENVEIKITGFFYRQFYSFRDNINEIRSSFFSTKNLIKENKELDLEINRLILENTKLKLAQKENKILREQLNFIKKSGYQYLIVNVVGKIQDTPGTGQSLIIDAGKKDGLKVGYPVIIAQDALAEETQGFLLGKIIEVKENLALVLLVTHHQSLVAATILNQEELNDSLVRGVHDLSMEMELIPIDRKIAIGDLVITSGLEQYIPRGLIIGEIENIIVQPSDIFQKARLKSLIFNEDFKVLTVLKPKDENF